MSPGAGNGVLRAGDVISVQVFREADLSLDATPIAEDGTIALPLIGTIKAAGLTPAQLSQQVTQRLSKTYLVSPQVTVNLQQYASHLVSVEGAVEKPGVYPFAGEARLSSAVALAGGTSDVAKMKQVVIFRHDAQGQSVAVFDYSAVQAGTMIDPVLMPGDRVVVGLSGMTQAWQDLVKSLPALAIFTRL
ncbi:polysaccharide biosynthesis/export family protein [Novosphingobium sp. 9]|uniref:polysaccharide biosynthesis/export family protein n=1 Tax=Novosphingobium sp. 9 TaxID=2025349 RepID=UPI0021B61F9C|nr:polysaccharide biosynthesis/export family protein [Novosphingobium sp. 9]